MDWDRFLSTALVVIVLLMTGVLFWIAVSLGRIEREFKTVQVLQDNVQHLNGLTECLEPAREAGHLNR